MKYLTGAISLSSVLISVAVFYYYVIFLPNQDLEKANFQKQEELRKSQVEENIKYAELSQKCSEAGKKYIKEYQLQTNEKGMLWDDPEFHFNKKMNTCLVYSRYLVLDDAMRELGTFGKHYNQIVDVNSNKILLISYFSRFVSSYDNSQTETMLATLSNAPNVSSTEFFERKQALMSE